MQRGGQKLGQRANREKVGSTFYCHLPEREKKKENLSETLITRCDHIEDEGY